VSRRGLIREDEKIIYPSELFFFLYVSLNLPYVATTRNKKAHPNKRMSFDILKKICLVNMFAKLDVERFLITS